MQIRAILLPTALFAGISTAHAQSNPSDEFETEARRETRFEFGARAGGFISMPRSDGYLALNNLHGVSGGAVARMRSGKEHRFGLEVAAHHAVTERSFTTVHDGFGQGLWQETAGYRKLSTDLGVQWQVHPGRDDQAVRPYVGVGVGAVWNRYVSENVVLDGYFNNSVGGPAVSAMLQMEQGLMWQIADHWSVSQSLHYRYEMDYGVSSVGIRFGIFYGL